MLESKRSYDAGGALPRKRSDEIVATRNDGGSHLGSFARRYIYIFFQFPIGRICILRKVVLGSFQSLDLICFFDVCLKKNRKDDTKPPTYLHL